MLPIVSIISERAHDRMEVATALGFTSVGLRRAVLLREGHSA